MWGGVGDVRERVLHLKGVSVELSKARYNLLSNCIHLSHFHFTNVKCLCGCCSLLSTVFVATPTTSYAGSG